jgi:plasmid stabilization system protein ParE
MTYSLHITPGAEADIERLYFDLVERRGIHAAQQWYEAYTRALERLRVRPLSCGFAYENPNFPVELRHLLFWTRSRWKYRALFTIEEDQVQILTVRAPRMKPVDPDDVEL